eukprot:3686857-Amphidinium_carterae.1
MEALMASLASTLLAMRSMLVTFPCSNVLVVPLSGVAQTTSTFCRKWCKGGTELSREEFRGCASMGAS